MNAGTPAPPRHALILNRGSSSLRFSLFLLDPAPLRVWNGSMERLGSAEATVTWGIPPTGSMAMPSLGLGPGETVASGLADWIEKRHELGSIAAIGHRVVHGMHHTVPERVTASLLDELRGVLPCDPEHAAGSLELLETFSVRFPTIPQIACFDTAFHQTLPRVARIIPIPRRYEAWGIERYGFHGLSYEYLMDALKRLGDPVATSGSVILAHLGGGSSMAAVRDGRSMDTSMGFTPAGGLPMGTRSGDLDPGVALFLMRRAEMTEASLRQMMNRESGLLGISETSSDMRDLLSRESDDPRAGEAIAVFCYAAKKQLGAYAAALGGLDSVVFTGGIGENCASIRSRICDGLRFLGISLDPTRNESNSEIISADGSRVIVRVLHTDEEHMIAQSVRCLLEKALPPP